MENAAMTPLWWWNPQAWTPQAFTQPILPGWSFGNITVNEQNSRSPQTEEAIVAEHSYGRQLGRITDALVALIEERPKGLPRNKAFDDLVALRASIELIKARSAASRVERLEADLARLKLESPQDYRRIAARSRVTSRDNRLLVAAIAASQFAQVFMISGVAVALPAMGVDLNAGAASLGLVETLFLAGSVAFLLPVGRLADASDKATLFKLGAISFGVCTLLVPLFSSVAVILFLRFMQGCTSAISAATGAAIVADVVPPERRGAAYGITIAAVYAGLTVGPVC